MPVSLSINGHAVPVRTGVSLFELADEAGIRVPTSCVKQGKCRECILEIQDGEDALSLRTEAELHLSEGFRLACQCRPVAEEAEIRCHTMRRGQVRIERHAFDLPVTHQMLPLDPAVTRDGDRVMIDGEEIDRSRGPLLGLAVDIGTTTVVLRLLDLESGDLVADTSFENPQRFGGTDVMARIRFDEEHGGRLLMRTLAGYLSHAIEELPMDPAAIYEVVVVGNATMRDLFFRRSVYSIGQSPYQSVTELDLAAGRCETTAVTQTGRRALLPVHPDARVVGLPVISGHVGADTAACMLAVDLAHEDRLVAVMDIGTNTELILGTRDRILAASCPAGPAFEGGAISCGMPGLDGAVEGVSLDDSGRFALRVIGDAEPAGICGSGLVELLSELLRAGWMDPFGRFEDEHGDEMERIDLDPAHGLYLTESDTAELAQAKGANVAGLCTVFDEYGVRFEDVDVFYVAGAFGRHLDLDAARRIGLLPDLPREKFVQIGNGAIEGACMALLSRAKRRELEALVRSVQHCRLETHPQFFHNFVEGCQFKPVPLGVSARP